MIDAALSLIASQLDHALRPNEVPRSDPVAVLTNLAEFDGSGVSGAADKLAVFLLNIERETATGRAMGRVEFGAGRIGMLQPPVHLNLLLMFVANFSGTHYREGLKCLARTIEFFQSRPVLDHANTPDLHRDIERLSLEMETLSLSDLGNLWGVLGGSMRPAVLYRMRMITIDAARLHHQVPAVTRPGVTAGG